MKDWLFFPLATLVATAIVLFALRMGGPQERLSSDEIRAVGYGLTGDDLIDLTASPGTELVVGGGTAKLLAVQSQADAPPSAGIFLTLPTEAEAAFAGQPLRVTWRARRERGEGAVRVGYFTLGAGDSGWQERTLGEAWSDVTLDFTPGLSGDGFDYAGIWPGVGDPDGVPVEVESVRVTAR